MKFGAHISAAGGVQNLPKRAKEIGAQTFQFFSRSPQGGSAPELTKENVEALKKDLKELGITEYYMHSPYYVNLASPKKRIYQNSVRILREEIERGTTLGATGMMFHPGSAKGHTREKALKQVMTGIKEITKGYKGTCLLLIENSAGAGEIIGDNFEEIETILSGLTVTQAKHVGVCLDTQHMFASGYDLRTKKDVNKTLKEIEKRIGWKNVKLFHTNDSKTEFDSSKDRHEHIGKGKIGLEGFRALLAHPKVQAKNFILETPKNSPKEDKANLKTLRSLAPTS